MSLNGGLIPFGGTFLTFSDYMKPAIRLAALSEVQVVYVFTHDSVGLGEDGPTHQPIEHLAGLRAIPHLYVIRPADAHETREAWRVAILRRDAPTALASRARRCRRSTAHQVCFRRGLATRRVHARRSRGTNTARPATPALILIATGSEVSLALEAREKLQAEGVAVRVVSMPCWELFEEQEQDYRDEVLPPRITARLAVEAGVRQGWDRYVGARGDCVCLDRFGASAPGEEALANLGFNVENVVARARGVLEQ